MLTNDVVSFEQPGPGVQRKHDHRTHGMIRYLCQKKKYKVVISYYLDGLFHLYQGFKSLYD